MGGTLRFTRDTTILPIDTTGGTAAGYHIGDWQPLIVTPTLGGVPDPIVETMDLRVNTSSHDTLAGTVQALADMQRWADEYTQDQSGTIPVWLQSQLTGETNGRRAYVRALDARYMSNWYAPAMDTDKTAILALSVERGPYWEGTAATTGANASAKVMGGTCDYTAGGAADIPGDVPARVANLAVSANFTYDRFWIGFRSVNKHGALNNYVPVISGNTWANQGTTNVQEADATARDGQRTTVTFNGGVDWASKVAKSWDMSGTSSYIGNTGRHLAILRAKMTTTAGTAEVRYYPDYLTSYTYAHGQPVQVAGTLWKVYPLGLWDHTWQPTFYLQARRTSSAGTLHLCSVAFIPVDEYFIYAEGLGVTTTSASTISTRADDQIRMVTASNYNVPNVSHLGAGVPTGDGRIVVCASGLFDSNDYEQPIGGTVTVNVTTYPRWLSLRGSE